jgi:DNA repair ATPase RecN
MQLFGNYIFKLNTASLVLCFLVQKTCSFISFRSRSSNIDLFRHYSLLLQSIELNNWGVFNTNACYIDLDPIPRYISITGENGAGKSILIDALSYLCGRTKTSKFRGDKGYIRLNLQNTTGHDDVIIEVSFDPVSRRSSCQCNGKKVTLKSQQAYLKNAIRFWSPSDIQKLDDDNFIEYIDSNCDNDHLEALEQLSEVYVRWVESYSTLQDMLALDTKIKQGHDRFHELTTAVQGIEALQVRVAEVFESVCVRLTSVDKDQEVLQLLRQSSKDGPIQSHSLNLAGAWEALGAADIYLKKMSKIRETLRTSVAKTDSAAAPARYDLRGAEHHLSAFSDDIVGIQSQLQGLGWEHTSERRSFDELALAAQQAVEASKRLQSYVRQIVSDLPDTKAVLAELSVVRGEWESMAKKHGVTPPDLHARLESSRHELGLISNLDELLPRSLQEEAALSVEYVMLARAVSRTRRASAADLAAKVNALLPSLEIHNKAIAIQHRSRIDALKDGSDEELETLQPNGKGVCQNGFDSISIRVESNRFVGPSASEPFYSFSTIQESPSQSTIHQESSDDVIDEKSVSIAKMLSSGELARLALALEAMTVNSSDATLGQKSLLILDEIDAHVGGEAAVAVAKLLKALGRRQQIIAVTHNPLLAAAADIHLTVARLDKGDSSMALRLQDKSQREQEISRMATGTLSTTAGSDLARALLDVDFSTA